MAAQKWHTLSICVPMDMMDDTKEIKRESCSVSTMITDDVVPECLMLQLSKKIFQTYLSTLLSSCSEDDDDDGQDKNSDG